MSDDIKAMERRFAEREDFVERQWLTYMRSRPWWHRLAWLDRSERCAGLAGWWTPHDWRDDMQCTDAKIGKSEQVSAVGAVVLVHQIPIAYTYRKVGRVCDRCGKREALP